MKPEGEPQWDPSLWVNKSRKGKRSSGDGGGTAVIEAEVELMVMCVKKMHNSII